MFGQELLPFVPCCCWARPASAEVSRDPQWASSWIDAAALLQTLAGEACSLPGLMVDCSRGPRAGSLFSWAGLAQTGQATHLVVCQACSSAAVIVVEGLS